MGHNYAGHNYIGHNYIGLAAFGREEAPWLLPLLGRADEPLTRRGVARHGATLMGAAEVLAEVSARRDAELQHTVSEVRPATLRMLTAAQRFDRHTSIGRARFRPACGARPVSHGVQTKVRCTTPNGNVVQ